METILPSDKTNYEDNQIMIKYFRSKHSSLIKFTKDTQKFAKFREKWINYRKISSRINPEDGEVLPITTTNKRNTISLAIARDKKNYLESVKKKESIIINKEKDKENISKKRSSFHSLHGSIKDVANTDPNSKIFICIGGYPAIKQALLDRGWSENSDGASLNFNLKWALKTKDIPPISLLNKHQIVNHFLNNIEITKKSGLQKNLRNLIFRNIDINNFYPRSYELSERNDFEDFLEDFKATKALGILKSFYLKSRSDISEDKLKTAIEICQRKLNYFNSGFEIDGYVVDNKLNVSSVGIKRLISEREWSIIGEEDMKNYIKEIEKLEKMNKIGYVKTERRLSSILPSEEEKKVVIKSKFSSEKIENLESAESVRKEYEPIVNSILDKFRETDPQFLLNGEKNIWILKPSGLSRGRGIVCINTMNEVLNLIKRNSNQYIAQKYIENPLVCLNRKFDIRQWVLVTDLNPLTIWLYDTPYLRFGAEDYKLEEFSNLYSHLTNNSVVKYSKNFSDKKIEGNMWDIQQFAEHLNNTYGREIWKSELQEKIKKIVILSLESAKLGITARKNSHELFGYDIMVDDQLNCWLIEVNSSPAMDYSTAVTEKLVKLMSEDLIKVVVDLKEGEGQGQGESTFSNVDTGRFIKIHKGETINDIYLPNK